MSLSPPLFALLTLVDGSYFFPLSYPLALPSFFDIPRPFSRHSFALVASPNPCRVDVASENVIPPTGSKFRELVPLGDY